MRLNKFITQAGYCSRRKADELIQNGSVTVNEKQIIHLGTKINPEKDIVKIQGNTLIIPQEKIYIAFHKPSGVTTTAFDPHAEKTIYDFIPKKLKVHPVGRLDKDTEGLLLLTNDGDFTYHLTHPKFECEKEYYAKMKGNISKNQIKRLEKGIKIPAFTHEATNSSKNRNKISKNTHICCSPAKISHLQTLQQGYETTLHIIIHEGKKRQIRKMFQSLGHPVIYLKRIRIGNLEIKNLKRGSFQKLSPQELKKAFPTYFSDKNL